MRPEMAYSGGDRRASARRGLQVPVYLNFPNTWSVTSGRTHDISLGGMKVKTEMPPLPFQKGDELSFIVNEDFLFLEGEGKVIWTSPIEVTAGIKFNQFIDKARSSLGQSLSLLS